VTRPPAPNVDSTPLDGSYIDIPARIGWLQRIWRQASDLTIGDMSAALSEQGLKISIAALSGYERTGTRDGWLIDGYEEALGLPAGQLRCPIDLTCDMFDESPKDRRPQLRSVVTLEAFDQAYAAVAGAAPAGSDWYRFARMLGGPASAGTATVWALPSELVAPLAARLLGEVVRGVGLAYMTRLEATSMLQASIYQPVVERVVREMVADEGAQSVMINALCAVADHPSPELLAWTATLLSHPSPWAVVAASYALQSMRTAATLAAGDWAAVVPEFVKASRLPDSSYTCKVALTELFKNLPPEIRVQISPELETPLEPVHAPESWQASRRNRHYALCTQIGQALADEAGLGDQPMLARMIFELVYDFRGPRRSAAAHLLMCSPVVDALEIRLLELIEGDFDEATRAGAMRGLHFVQAGRVTDATQAWFDRSQPWRIPSALVIAGNAGVRLPDAIVDLVVDDGEESLRIVEALGMTRHPALESLHRDTTRTPQLRSVAGWWLDRGGRVAR